MPARRPTSLVAPTRLALGTFIACAGVAGLASCGTVKTAVPDAGSTVESQVALPVHQVIEPQGRRDFVGSKTCVSCHKELTGQLHTRHARTLAPAAGEEHRRRFAKGEYADGRLNAFYTTRVRDGKMILGVSTDMNEREIAADYAFGSGNVAVTYVSTRTRPPMELRLSSYRNGEVWDLTPGQVKPGMSQRHLGKPMDWKTEEECFLCHSTALVKESNHIDFKQSIFGIGCETCHGAGREHVRAAKAGKGSVGMVRLGDHQSAVSIKVCGQCHRSPNNVDLEDPGQRVQLPRWQALAISMSDCFKKGKVSCMTCHDPHADADKRSQPAYNAICMSCHQPSQPKQRACRRAPTGDCVSCHMPKQEIGMPTNPTFHNHWIKVWEKL